MMEGQGTEVEDEDEIGSRKQKGHRGFFGGFCRMSPETLNLNMLNSVYSPSPSPYSPGEEEEEMDLEDSINMLPLP